MASYKMVATRYCSVFLMVMVMAWLHQPVQGRSPFLKLENNGYENVVVALESEMSQQNGMLVVQKLKNILTHASFALYRATRKHVYLKQITILLPALWSDLPENITDPVSPATYETYEEADIQVELDDVDNDNSPYTMRAGGCGELGEHIRLNAKYVKTQLETVDNKAKALVREWAQFRYGVFDECGNPGDPVNPTFYITARNNTIAPTGCVNVERLAGDIISCADNSKAPDIDPKCDFKPDLPASATSSLMYMPYLPKVVDFCDETTHDHLAPTRQNIFCREQSVWDVIKKKSQDFVNLNPLDIGEEEQKPTFRIVKAAKSGYIVVLDTSHSMGNSYQTVRKAVKSFIDYQVPSGSPLGLVQFDSGAEVKLPLQLSRQKFNNVLPTAPSSFASLSDAAAALSKAAEVNMDGAPVQKVIVMITAGQWQTPFNPAIQELCTQLITNRIRVNILLLQPPRNHDVYDAIRDLTACTGGSQRLILSETSSAEAETVTLLQELDAGLRDTLKANSDLEQVVQIHSKSILTPANPVMGAFSVDSSIGTNSNIRVIYNKDADVSDIKVTAPDLRVFTKADEEYKSHERGFVFSEQKFQEGTWQYEIKRPEDGSGGPLAVVVTSHARTKEPISVRCWTNMAYEDVVVGSTPVIIYAEVKQGRFAVSDADVKAVVEAPRHETIVALEGEADAPHEAPEHEAHHEALVVPHSDSSSSNDAAGLHEAPHEALETPHAEALAMHDNAELRPESHDVLFPPNVGAVQQVASLPQKLQIETTLLDDGSGDPDINLGDGIYSSYFTSMPRTGLYTIRVRVRGTHRTKLLGETSATDSFSDFFGCRRKQLYTKRPTREFERIVTCSSFHVLSTGGMPDPYLPARITDLRLESKDLNTGEATIAWTAVGDNYHEGQVSSYEVRVDSNRDHLKGDDLSKAALATMSMKIERPRTKQVAIVKLPERNRLFYIAVRGQDRVNNAGPTSNIIGVVMPELPPSTAMFPSPTTTSDTNQLKNDTVTKEKTETASVGAGAIVGIVIAAVLIVVIVAIVFIVTTKRRREEERRRMKAKSQRYDSVPREEQPIEDDDQGGFVAENSQSHSGKRDSKGIASSNTSV